MLALINEIKAAVSKERINNNSEGLKEDFQEGLW